MRSITGGKMSEAHEKCPNCGSDNLENGNTHDRYTTSEEELVRDVTCHNCGASWNEIWRCTDTECFELPKVNRRISNG